MKTIKAEILMIEGAPFPAIEKVYDPSSKKCNGRITPQAPIVITGHHLDMLTWDTTIPDIDEGEYFLALMILMKDKESFLYIFPISLIVQFT